MPRRVQVKSKKLWIVGGLVAAVAITTVLVFRIRSANLMGSATDTTAFGGDDVARPLEGGPLDWYALPRPRLKPGLDDTGNPEEDDPEWLEGYRSIFRSNEVELAQRLELTPPQLEALKRVHREITEEAERARQRGEDPVQIIGTIGRRLYSDFLPLLNAEQAVEFRRWGKRGGQQAYDTMAVREAESLQKTLELDDERLSLLMVALTDAYSELREQRRKLSSVEYFQKEAELKKRAAKPILSAKQFEAYAEIIDGQLEAHEFSLGQEDE